MPGVPGQAGGEPQQHRDEGDAGPHHPGPQPRHGHHHRPRQRHRGQEGGQEEDGAGHGEVAPWRESRLLCGPGPHRLPGVLAQDRAGAQGQAHLQGGPHDESGRRLPWQLQRESVR